jgi:hypothetical protein
MKIFKLFIIAISFFSISGCVFDEGSLVYPEPEPCNVIWINGIPYYYLNPGIYYRVYIQDGNYRYLNVPGPGHISIPSYPGQRIHAHPHSDKHHGGLPPSFHSRGRR